MAGCMVATSLAMAPAMLLAQTARFVDLDGPLLLAKDRADGLRYARQPGLSARTGALGLSPRYAESSVCLNCPKWNLADPTSLVHELCPAFWLTKPFHRRHWIGLDLVKSQLTHGRRTGG